MGRTLKEQEALKQAQSIAEKLGEDSANMDGVNLTAPVGIIWGLIAIHQVLERLNDRADDLLDELWKANHPEK